ncbi:MAG TPA: hypothetical protein QKA08_05450 [Candidatus Megaira endosymbiont of Nemacystus decipiens]|nr:hypothetical protein [Candidatus Megaera endosymbiont of Nemacystus decipiens]
MPKLNKQKEATKLQSKTLNNLEKQLFEAAKNRDDDKFKEITEQGVDPLTKDEFGLEAIYYFLFGNLSPEDAKDIKYMLDNYKSELRLMRKDPKEW